MALSVAGTIVTVHGCRSSSNKLLELIAPNVGNVQLTPGSLYTGDVWGLAASVLSLVTNTAATTLIAYKAWYALRVLQ